MLACKVAPTIAGSTNETKTEVTKMLARKVAPTIADSTNKTKNADSTIETIKVPDNVYAEVCAILAALRTLADAVLLGRATRSGGTGRHHGRPPDSQGAPYKVQPKTMVYKPGAMTVGGQIKNQLGSGGGAEQRHGRPPDSQGVPDKVQFKKKRLFGRAKRRHGRPPDSQDPTTISPPSAIALKDSSMLSVGAAVQSAMGDTVAGTFLSTFAVVSKPGSAASAAKHDETSLMPLALHTPHTPSFS
jgi:hypothetical protein